jgi:TolA-binding protein
MRGGMWWLGACLAVTMAPGMVRADAAGDLAAGQAALAAGDAAKALPLLVSAAQALPQSVEAQLALAKACLATGDLEKALAAFQSVLRLSPDHAEAKRMVEALTGQRQTFEQKLAYVRALLDLGLCAQAQPRAEELVRGPYEPAQRLAARMALVESILWAGNVLPAVVEATRAVQEAAGTPTEGPARILAALSLLASDRADDRARAAEMVKAAGELKDPYARWADLVRLVLRLDEKSAANVSAELLKPNLLPPGGYRDTLTTRLVKDLLGYAHLAIGRGEPAEALKIVWPMLSSGALPAAAPAAPLDLTTGWLRTAKSVPFAAELVDTLSAAGQADFAGKGAESNLLAFAIAGDVLRSASQPDVSLRQWGLTRWPVLAQQVGMLSRPAPNRKKGALLSPADELQRQWILALADLVSDEAQRGQLVDLVLVHVGRYEAADDLATGLARFVMRRDGEPLGGVTVLPAVAPGPAHQRLLATLAGKYAQLGQKAFAEAAASLSPKANLTLNPDDETALILAAALRIAYPATAPGAAVMEGILERYAAAGKWSAAERAAALYYRQEISNAGRWAAVRLLLRQGLADEDKRLAANQGLAAALNANVAEALKQARSVLLANLDEPTKNQMVALADPLVWRYVGLNRYDLATAVIDTVSPPTEPAVFAGPTARVWLTEWPIWMKALLAEREGDAALAAAAARFDGAEKVALTPQHRAALDLHHQLLTKNPRSPVMDGRVEHLLAIPRRYQDLKAYGVAVAILDEFIKLHPDLTATERVEFVRVQVLLEQARTVFAERKEPTKAPEALSPEYAAALDALAAFLKAHPAGPYSLSAENHLFNAARTYGEAGAWPVARTVLGRFRTAVPDFRAPERLRFIEAATHLGELDRQHGLALIVAPTVETPAARTTTRPMTDDEWSELAQRRRKYSMLTSPAEEADLKNREDAARQIMEAEQAPAAGPATGGGRAGRAGTPTAQPMPRPVQPGLPEYLPPTDTGLVAIRQAEQQQLTRLARLEDSGPQMSGDQRAFDRDGQGYASIVLPVGSVLSEAEMKRQDAAADAAYALLIALAKDERPAAGTVPQQARAEIIWLISFFEGQRRTDRAVALIDRFLKDRPTDPGRIGLSFQALADRLAWAGQRQPTEKIDLAWVDKHHGLFEAARTAIGAFIADYAAKTDWVNRARMLAVTSYEQEAGLASAVSAARAAGLLSRAADELLALSRAVPDHPDAAGFPQRLWGVADRLVSLGQRDQAIYVLSQVPIRFPSDALANQSVLRVAGLFATDLSAPLRAVETYQEYLNLAGDNESIRSQVFSLGQQLTSKKRYLEALHVYGVFVDSFPTDQRAAQALLAMGQVHQANEAWADAMKAYRRILTEYAGGPTEPQVKLAMAECQINLSEWRAARKLYEEFVQAYAGDPQAALARNRIETLKSLDRYQALIADKQVTRNKDDAQMQIGRIVLERLDNRVKAVAEFKKVLAEHAKSHLADDAQFEIGKALLDLGRPEEARVALLKVPAVYPESPLAGKALFLVGQSYERQAEALAAVTLVKAREEAFERGQRGAYQQFQVNVAEQQKSQAVIRDQLRKGGKAEELDLSDAYAAARFNTMNDPNVRNWARQAEQEAETESALQVANRQDRINEAYRQAVAVYARTAKDYPLSDATDDALLRMAQIYETNLKDRADAMATYQKIVKFFPGTAVAEDAAWKVAKFYEQEGNWNEAANAYRDFIRTWPTSARVADAQFAMAEALEQAQRWVEAMDAYQTFRDKFAQHPKAPAAKDQMEWIRAYRM